MKCKSCKYLWNMSPQPASPYGESACMKTEQDLWGFNAEDVEDCKDYEVKER